MNWNDILWLGSVCFALCGIEPAWIAWKTKRSDLPWSLLVLWFFGELIYIINSFVIDSYAMLFNYGINFICLIILIYYRVRPWLK